MIAPLEFQRDAVAHHVKLLRDRRASAEGSVAGFGKTFVASFVAREMGAPMVVVCPKVVIPHWENAARMCGATIRCVSNYEQYKAAPRRTLKNSDGTPVLDHAGRPVKEKVVAAHRSGKTGMGEWAILGRQWRWTFPKPTLLVIDEAHYCKSRDSQNSKFVVAAKRQGIPTMVMSATLAQDPTDLFSVGYLLGLHDGGTDGWKNFQSAHGVIASGFDFKFDPRHDPTALSRLNAALFPARGHRKTYDQIPGFPEATTDVREVVGDPDKLATMERAWARTAELEQLSLDAINSAVERLRARQIAELAKVPAIIDLAKELKSSGLSVPIFLNFHDAIDEVSDALRCGVIDGRTINSQRQTIIDRFQADLDHTLVLQTAAGGVGISLHDTRGERPRHSLISPGENARDLIQALGRNRRVGQKSPAFRTILTLAGSVEQKVKRNVERKANQIEEINDGDLDPLFHP